jgi:hypothetical protein
MGRHKVFAVLVRLHDSSVLEPQAHTSFTGTITCYVGTFGHPKSATSKIRFQSQFFIGKAELVSLFRSTAQIVDHISVRV